MKLAKICLVLTATSSASAAVGKRWWGGHHWGQGHHWGGGYHWRGGCISSWEAETIVNKLISVLENAEYQGQSPQMTAKQIVAKDYMEHSDSILSLEGVPLGDTPSATSRKQWLSEVTQHPDPGIQTLDILHSCDKIMWHWLFPHVGTGQYEVKGFNLITLNKEKKIARMDLEFNSIAWGLDTMQIYQYCPPPPNGTEPA